MCLTTQSLPLQSIPGPLRTSTGLKVVLLVFPIQFCRCVRVSKKDPTPPSAPSFYLVQILFLVSSQNYFELYTSIPERHPWRHDYVVLFYALASIKAAASSN
mmetsp:Transcript_25080/g.36733  ORF Transcript_25080/g.36733 Transcript_25080/m.36733 type:complete len:102 (-) Transcript_25080:32-337(-)